DDIRLDRIPGSARVPAERPAGANTDAPDGHVERVRLPVHRHDARVRARRAAPWCSGLWRAHVFNRNWRGDRGTWRCISVRPYPPARTVDARWGHGVRPAAHGVLSVASAGPLHGAARAYRLRDDCQQL